MLSVGRCGVARLQMKFGHMDGMHCIIDATYMLVKIKSVALYNCRTVYINITPHRNLCSLHSRLALYGTHILHARRPVYIACIWKLFDSNLSTLFIPRLFTNCPFNFITTDGLDRHDNERVQHIIHHTASAVATALLDNLKIIFVS